MLWKKTAKRSGQTAGCRRGDRLQAKPPLPSHLHLGWLGAEKSIRGFRRSRKALSAKKTTVRKSSPRCGHCKRDNYSGNGEKEERRVYKQGAGAQISPLGSTQRLRGHGEHVPEAQNTCRQPWKSSTRTGKNSRSKSG